MIRYVTINRFAELSGYSVNAIHKRRQRGLWKENEIWIKAPDGRILIDIEGYKIWAVIGANTQALDQRREQRSKLIFNTKENEFDIASNLSPPPLT